MDMKMAEVNLFKEIENIDKNLYKRLKNISIDELVIFESLGKGSFGEVRRAEWNGMVVAIKKAESHSEVKAFANEVYHLSRAFHENIIHLFGVSLVTSKKYLIMDYADGGSLYHFLHNLPYQSYNIINALSWLMQCARAIDYLHSYQPKAIIHRDLKSLNMLLKNGKKVLKICDFGTACDQSTIMTGSKGSVAWMAPEVMNGNKYDEKCDVYSYGMFIWEILTRKVPGAEFFHQVRIMYQVLNNWRPPLIKGCPRPIQELMTRCWDKEYKDRPSMKEVLQIVTTLFILVNGGEELAEYISSSESFTESYKSNLNATGSEGQTSHDVSEFPTDSTYDFQGNINGSKKKQLMPIESNSSLMEFDDNSNYDRRPTSSSYCDGSSTQEEENNQYEQIEIFKEEPDHVPRPVFRDRCPDTVGENILIPLNINIPDSELSEQEDLLLSIPKTSKINVKISPRPSTIFQHNYPTINYNLKKFVPVPNPTSKLLNQPSHNRYDSSYQSPIVANCIGHHGISDGVHYLNIPAPLRHHDIPRDPMVNMRRRSAEVSQVDGNQAYGHRRSSSYESSNLIGFEPLEMEMTSGIERSPYINNFQFPSRHIGCGDCNQPASKPVDLSNQLKNSQLPTNECWPMISTPKPDSNASELGDLWQYLDEELKPAKAIPSCPQSQKIYENHKEMAHDLLVVQEKVFYLNQKKQELLDLRRKQDINHKSSKQHYQNRITELEQTNQNLRQRQHKLNKDVELVQTKKRQQDQRTKMELSYNHKDHLYQQKDIPNQSYQRQYNQHPQGHTPYCKCYENAQPPVPPGQRDSYVSNPNNVQTQNHISQCSYHNSYYRH